MLDHMPVTVESMAHYFIERFSDFHSPAVLEAYADGLWRSLEMSKLKDTSGFVTDSVIQDMYSLNIVALVGNEEDTLEKLEKYSRAHSG